MERKGDKGKKKANASNLGGESGSQQKKIIDMNDMYFSSGWNDLVSVDDMRLYLRKDSTYPVLAEINPIDRCINVSPDWNQHTLMDAESFYYLAHSTYLASKELNPPDKCRSAQTSTSKKHGTYLKKVVNRNKIIDARWSQSLNSKDSADQIVERKSIEAYFDIHPNSERCPTKKVLSSQELAPDDNAFPTQIKRWQKNKTTDDERRNHFRMLLRRLAYSGEVQLASAAELRALVSDFPSLAKVFCDIGPSAVLELARPLLSQEGKMLESMRENIIVTFKLLAEHSIEIRTFFIHHPTVVDIIVDSFRIGSVEMRHSAVAFAYYIAKVPCGREVLSQTGITEHLTELLEEGNLLLLNEVISVLFQLDARSLRIINGILTVILNHLGDENSVPYLQCLLDQVMKDKVVWEHVAATEMIHAKVLEILKEGKSDAVKGFYAETLLCIIQSSKHAMLATREYEAEHHEITEIVETGMPEAKEIAIKLCEVLCDHSPLDEIQHIELQSVDATSSHKLDHTAEPEPYGMFLDFLQVTESGDEMEVWMKRLITHIERSEGALIVTWMREEKFGVITRVKLLGNSDAQNAADKILEMLNVVRQDRFPIVYSRRKSLTSRR